MFGLGFFPALHTQTHTKRGNLAPTESFGILPKDCSAIGRPNYLCDSWINMLHCIKLIRLVTCLPNPQHNVKPESHRANKILLMSAEDTCTFVALPLSPPPPLSRFDITHRLTDMITFWDYVLNYDLFISKEAIITFTRTFRANKISKLFHDDHLCKLFIC